MPLYENQTCPVCNVPFQQGDDVVYCPECGTPHHRACYQQLNRCANVHLHGSGFNFFEENKPEEPENIVAEAKALLAPKHPANEEETTERPPYGGFPPFGAPLLQAVYENDQDTIGGESVADVAAAVRTNTPRFIAVFKKQEKTGKKASWNWGAFFFGAYYFLFRKMYKQGFLLFALNFALNFAESFAISKLAPQTAQALSDYAAELTSGKVTPAALATLSSSLTGTADYKTFLLVQGIFMALSVLFTVLFAVYADHIYKKTVVQLVKRTKERLAEDDELSLNVQTPEEVRLTDEQLKRLYLAQRGGTTYLVPMLALLVMSFVSTLQ